MLGWHLQGRREAACPARQGDRNGEPLWLCFVREIMGNHGKSWEIICITLDETMIDYDSF